jgi:hypothetical protein
MATGKSLSQDEVSGQFERDRERGKLSEIRDQVRPVNAETMRRHHLERDETAISDVVMDRIQGDD